MNIESKIELVVEKNGNRYVFSMPMGVHYGEAYDAAFEALLEIGRMSQEAAEKAKRKPQDD